MSGVSTAGLSSLDLFRRQVCLIQVDFVQSVWMWWCHRRRPIYFDSLHGPRACFVMRPLENHTSDSTLPIFMHRLNEENYNNDDVLGIVDHASMMVLTTHP